MNYDSFEEEKELYTFAEYCAVFNILPFGSNSKDYAVMWNVHGQDYISHCKDSGLDYENIGYLLGE